MVDMGQCDSLLRQRALRDQDSMSWSYALRLAAKELGYEHYMDVPLEDDEALRCLAHSLRNGETK